MISRPNHHFYFLLLLLPLNLFAQEVKIVPAPNLRVWQSDTPEEKLALSETYYGVTTDGTLVQDLYRIRETGVSTAGIATAVSDFLSSLSAEQRAICLFSVDDQEWRRWSNIDFYKRKGIGLLDLNPEQRQLAFQILMEGLSASGFEKVENIRKMEGYLARLANDFERLGPDRYWFTFLGEPSKDQPWGWQFDGHHCIINYFVLGDQVVMTPTFMGSEPNYIVDGENQGTRTFKNEEALGFELFTSLNAEQRQMATLLNTKEYNYNQAESFSDNAVVPYAGIRYPHLDQAQQGLLNRLVAEYVGNMDSGHAMIKMEEIELFWDSTYFAWVGNDDDTQPFYYRVQSPVLMIEFDHQKPVFIKGDKPTKKHIHTVVRTPNGNDYGKDLLRQHLEKFHKN